MTTISIPRSILDIDEPKVCVFCDTLTDLPYCAGCQEYKGLMIIDEWESYSGERWEE
jgi:hypothetical protein